MTRMMIMAGGTGGHVIPALAVASELRSQKVAISWVGSRDGLEAKLVNEAGLDFDSIDIKGLRKSGVIRKLAMPFMLAKAMFQTLGILRKRKPDAVLGMGGFVSGPGGLVSALLRIPVILHEQNSVAGLTNRWLAKVSQRVMSGFPLAKGIDNVEWIGNPVRDDIFKIPSPQKRLANRTGPLRVLVVGGSQGASIFNEKLPDILVSIAELEVWHQCGKQGSPAISDRYKTARIKAQVEEFITDMAMAYEWCDILICRSGAMTVSEVCSAGVAAIFVPYPHAVSDHQAVNAAYLVAENAAYMVRQSEFIKGEWVSILQKAASDRASLIQMGDAARKLSKPNASSELAKVCMEVMNA